MYIPTSAYLNDRKYIGRCGKHSDHFARGQFSLILKPFVLLELLLELRLARPSGWVRAHYHRVTRKQYIR